VKFLFDSVRGMISSKIRVFGILLGAALLTACGGSGSTTPEGASATPTLIQLDGSSTVFPISEAVAEEFQKVNPNIRVTVGISGTGGGFQKFCRGETDISDASRPIRPAEIETCQKAGIEYIELPVAYDGLAVVVNPKNAWADRITVAELKTLWAPDAQGKVLRWNQVRSSWPNREIRLFGAGVDSGTYDYFTEAIVGKEHSSRGDFTSSEDDNVLVQGVAGDRYALGFFGYAYYEENQDKLALVAIDDGDDSNGAGAIHPSPDTVTNGTYRPLSRPIFIYVALGALERAEIRDFVTFYLDRGAPLVREVGYVALHDRERELVRQRFTARTTRTMYGEGAATMTLEERLSR